MADPIREALKRLLAVIKPKYTDPDEIVAVVRAMAAAHTALAAEPPAPAEHVATLHVSNFRGYENYDFQHLVDLPPGHYKLFTACTTQPPEPAPAVDGEREELARLLDGDGRYLVEAALARECQKTWELACRVIRAAVLLRQLPPDGLEAEEYVHADSGARIVREPCDGEPGWCWTVSNSRHVNPCTEFPTLAAAWTALQQARRQEPHLADHQKAGEIPAPRPHPHGAPE